MVSKHVRVEIGFLVEALVAAFLIARKRFLSRMDSQVGFQIEVQGKLLTAEIAVVRLLSL